MCLWLIRELPLTYIETIDEDLLRTAAKLQATYSISYADAFAAAIAINENAFLLTGDPEFQPLVEKENISIEWLL